MDNNYYWCFIWISVSNNDLDYEDGLGCDVMTLNEKRDKLDKYCLSHSCRHGDYQKHYLRCYFDGKTDAWCDKCLWTLPENEVDAALAKIDELNPYWDNVTEIANKQRKKGLHDYGQGLEANTASIIDRIQHLEEELVDALMYLEWIKDGVRHG